MSRPVRPWPIAALLLVLAGMPLVASLGLPGRAPSGAAAISGSPGPLLSAASPVPAPDGALIDPVGDVRRPEVPGPHEEVAAPPVVEPPSLGAILDAQLEALRERYGIPGISATILFPDDGRWTGVAGLADVAQGLPVRPGTPFALASVSKTFTAALILQLVGDGRLVLNDSAAGRLAGVAGIALDRRITIAHLLDHTSGLRDYFLNDKIEPAFRADVDARWTASQTLAFAGPPFAAPGSRYLYSNTNYLLLGLIAERVTGSSLAALHRERIFGPLNLATASYQGSDTPFLPLARGYRFDGPSPQEAPIPLPGTTGMVPFSAAVTASGGAGSVAAASPDVAAWERALYGGSVLGPGLTARMVDDAARPTAIDPKRPYGYGVQVLPIDGHQSLGHSGRFLGARAVVRHFPADGLTIAVLTNQSRTDPAAILEDLLRVTLRFGEPALPPLLD